MSKECIVCTRPITTNYGKQQSYCSISCSNKDRTRKNKEKYYLSPKRCRVCESPIDYEKRFDNTYCSRSCARVVTNAQRAKKKQVGACCYCGDEFIESRNSNNIYCSTNCSQLDKMVQTKMSILRGEIAKRGTLKKHLLEVRGHQCECCNQTRWMGEDIPLELDHIDGLANNNFPSNLRLLCPNCHAQQPTSKGKNRGNGRTSLGLPKS